MYTLSNYETKGLKVTKGYIIRWRHLRLYQIRRSSTDSMWLANVERVHGYLVPEICIETVSFMYWNDFSGLCSGKKHDLRYPGSCSYREIGNCGNRPEANRAVIFQALS